MVMKSENLYDYYKDMFESNKAVNLSQTVAMEKVTNKKEK